MKMPFVAAASAIFIFGTGFAGEAMARENVGEPHATHHEAAVIVGVRVTRRDGVLCTTEYLPTRDDRGWYIRDSVDCEE